MSRDVTLTTPYVEAGQQREADFLGMYLFLGSEVMLFGGLFAGLLVYRIAHPGAAARAALHLSLALGTANTAILLTSSLCMALGVLAARAGGRRAAAAWFAATAGLGLAFLAVKGIEYRREYLEGLMPMGGPPSPLAGRPAALFMDLYFVATALHAVHLGIGVAAVGTLAMRLARRRLRAPGQAIVAEMTGLYWHFVDVVWIFLFPVLYLARP